MKNGIYIHIPFCVKKCLYCDFNSSDKINHLKKAYKAALIQEIQSSPYKGEPADSVFIGGGTPTAMETVDLVEIIHCVQESFPLEASEFTVEVNPATLNYEGFCMLKQAGVNRISFGLQSAHNEELRTLGRIHTYEAFLQSYRDAIRAGFDNINLDLMFSLPGQTLELWQDTLETVIALQPQHLSCYSLIIEDGTPFSAMNLDLPDEETDRAIYDYTVERLAKDGYIQYEISNFAKAHKACKHNIKYWKRCNYLGFGAGASSLYNNCRMENTYDVASYIADNRPSVTQLTQADAISETIFLGLRMTEGIDLRAFREKFGFSMEERYSDILKKYVRLGLMEVDSHCRLTLAGVSVSNTIMAEFV